MCLRELKKEVAKLPNVLEEVKQFQDCWIKPLRINSNGRLSFLDELPKEVRKEINRKLFLLQDQVKAVQYGQVIQEKLRHHTRSLIELKLSLIQENKGKSALIINLLLNDDFFNLKQTISDVSSFEENVRLLHRGYDEINQMINENIKLEDAVHFMDIPHHLSLKNMLKAAKTQKKIVRTVGENFISLVKSSNEYNPSNRIRK